MICIEKSLAAIRDRMQAKRAKELQSPETDLDVRTRRGRSKGDF
jgi:hypothetical protein